MDKYKTIKDKIEKGDELKDCGVLGLVMAKFTKDLLLKDLCARLPYGVKAQYYGSEEEMLTVDTIEAIYIQPSVEIVKGGRRLRYDQICYNFKS